jgi:hypothetical protein
MVVLDANFRYDWLHLLEECFHCAGDLDSQDEVASEVSEDLLPVLFADLDIIHFFSLLEFAHKGMCILEVSGNYTNYDLLRHPLPASS